MMNDETEQFERRLRRQPVKQIPGEWRAEIVGQASRRSSLTSAKKTETGKMPVPLQIWREFFWPHPKAWAGLAAIWIFIFVLNFSMRDQMPVMAEKSVPASPEVVAELRQQQKMLAELIGSTELRVANRQPVFSPKPRSEVVNILMA